MSVSHTSPGFWNTEGQVAFFVCPLQKLFLGLIKPLEGVWFLLCIPLKIWLCLYSFTSERCLPLYQKYYHLLWPIQIYRLRLSTFQTHATLKCFTSQVALCSEMNSTNLFKQKLMWRRTFCAAGCAGRCLELKMLGLFESNLCNTYHLDFISSTILRPFVTQRLWGYRKLLQTQRLRIPPSAPFVSITDNHNRLYGSPVTSNYNVHRVSWPWRNKGLKQPHQRKNNLRNENHHRSIVDCLRANVSYFLCCTWKRDVCVTPSLIVFQRPAELPRSWEHAVIGWHTVHIVWLNADWLLSNLAW